MIHWPWKRAKAASTSAEAPAARPSDEAVPNGEYPVLGAARLLDRTGAAQIIEVMRTKVGFPRALFDGGVLPLLHAHAEFVQMLPALTPRRGEEAGGLLLHGLEAASSALDFRRGQILPRGAPPEAIGEQHHRWTYAVLVAALLHESESPFARLRVFLRRHGGEPQTWLPLMGALSSRETSSYRWEVATSPEDEAGRKQLALLLFDRCVPIGMIEWLSADAELVRELLRHLGGEAGERGVLRELAARGTAYAAGTEWRAIPPSTAPGRSAAPASVSPPEPEASADSGEDFLDPVDDPTPAPRRRKAR